MKSMKCLTAIKDNEVSLLLLTWQKFQDTLLVELGKKKDARAERTI